MITSQTTYRDYVTKQNILCGIAGSTVCRKGVVGGRGGLGRWGNSGTIGRGDCGMVELKDDGLGGGGDGGGTSDRGWGGLGGGQGSD